MTITGIIKSSGTKAAITALSIQEGASCWLIRNKKTAAACISIPRLTWPPSLHFVFLRSSKHSRQESFINLFDIKKLVFIKGGFKGCGARKGNGVERQKHKLKIYARLEVEMRL